MTQNNEDISKPLTQKRYGWKPDLPDARDKHYLPKIVNLADLPRRVDLTKYFSGIPILNQGSLGSCTANALAECFMACEVRQGRAPTVPSRLFIYYNERYMEGTVNEDAGAMIRTGIKSLVRQGVCPEQDWPYNVQKFRSRPTSLAYSHAAQEQVLAYERLKNTNVLQLMEVLSEGLPFVFGFSVYESFESMSVAHTGNYVPDFANEQIIGGHAVAAFGYDQDDKTFLIRNSWGAQWGINGYFKMRFQDITDENQCDDFWKLSYIE